ncbi:PAAR domain-containing protein [Paraliomyxa miuraensis]|uniref:PAAR domain-containing protein n=1 Tax=Paraliomyxa miuraensis TaxID=376150 RepID=UPI00225B16F1|nr:PAAR domain-containing protein [Paraliomyxa miuraensis]MCX4246514.1 PAAR domain-containing protein [Paraliomyxa miuraensis]
MLHVGGLITSGSPTVIFGTKPAARVSDRASCIGPMDVIAQGSSSVLFDGLPAARVGDRTIHGGVIVTGHPAIVIGGSTSGVGTASLGAGILLDGTALEQDLLAALLDQIRKGGPLGASFINDLETNAVPTHFIIADSATRNDGTVVSLANTGGGLTLRPTESISGDNEVYMDPTNLIDYTATDGTTVTETPSGLLLHEAGHAALLNAGDPAQTAGGGPAEANVRSLTNPIRSEIGMKPEQ